MISIGYDRLRKSHRWRVSFKEKNIDWRVKAIAPPLTHIDNIKIRKGPRCQKKAAKTCRSLEKPCITWIMNYMAGLKNGLGGRAAKKKPRYLAPKSPSPQKNPKHGRAGLLLDNYCLLFKI